MTILPRRSNFLSGLAGGASEGISALVQQKMLQKQWNAFLDSYQARQGAGATGGAGIGGATQPNPQAVFGEPGVGAPNQMMGGGQQNPIMRMLQGLGSGMGRMGQGVGAGLQGLGRGIGNIGQSLGGILGMGRPQRQPGAPMGMMGGQGMGPLAGAQGGMDPRILAILQHILGGSMSPMRPGFPGR